MAKELPYFKFEPNQWENGNIQICTREEKGLFIDLCSMYWSRLGDLSYKLALQKLCNGNATALQSLCDENIIEVIDGNIFIKFLSEQLSGFEDVSEQNSQNAKKRWEKYRKQKELSERNATALQSQSERNAIREEEIKEDKRKENEEEVKENILYNIDSNFSFYLKNDNIVNAVISNPKNKIKDKEYLEKRLKEFNLSLAETGQDKKLFTDYCSHFRSWHIKTLPKINGSKHQKIML